MSMYYDRNGDPITRDAWIRLWKDPAYRRITQQQAGSYWVSTVWLGYDHGFGDWSPVIFETLVTDKAGEVDMERYRTLAEAKAGHERWVREGRSPWRRLVRRWRNR